MRAAVVASLRTIRSGSNNSSCNSSSNSGTKAAKKLRKDERRGERRQSSDNVAAAVGGSPQLQASGNVYGGSAPFCTPALPCWAAQEHEALEQLTDAFFSRHRLHLRVWPVSAGGEGGKGEAGEETGEGGTGTDSAPAAGNQGGGLSSRGAAGGEAASRKGRVETATTETGKEDQGKKSGRRSSGLDRKGSAEGRLARSGAAAAAETEGGGGGGGRGAAGSLSIRSRRISMQKGGAATKFAEEATAVQEGANVEKMKHEEEEDEATKVRREQLINVRAMLYDRVTENVSFTCTEYNTPWKPFRNAKLPSFLQLRGIKAFSFADTKHMQCEDGGAAADATAGRSRAAAGRAGAGGGGPHAPEGGGKLAAARAAAPDNVAVSLHRDRSLQKEQEVSSEDCNGELKRESRRSCREMSRAAEADTKKEDGATGQSQQDGWSSGRRQQLQSGASTPAAAAVAGRKNAKPALLQNRRIKSGDGCSSSSSSVSFHEESKHACVQVCQDTTPAVTVDACGDPAKLRELQQSLSSDGFTGCWVLLLTEKYVPVASPTTPSSQQTSRRGSQSTTAGSFPSQTHNQRAPPAGEHQHAASPSRSMTYAAADGEDFKTAAGHPDGKGAATRGRAADAVKGEQGGDELAGPAWQQRSGKQCQQQGSQPQQQYRQPRVRRIIVCGALIEVYSNNERQIAALWCLPCLTAHTTRLLLQAFLPRVLLEALRIPDVVATAEEELQQQQQVRESGGSTKKRKWKQDGGLRVTRGGTSKQQLQQKSSAGRGSAWKKPVPGERQTKQQRGYNVGVGEKGAESRDSSSSAEEMVGANVSSVRRSGTSGGIQAEEDADAIQAQQVLRPIKSVFAVYEDTLLWPRQALFLLASPFRLGFLRHAEPLAGVSPDEEEAAATVAAPGRKKTGADEKKKGTEAAGAYRKQPYLHVDAGLGALWRECNCKKRFFIPCVQAAQQPKRKGTSSTSSSSKGSTTTGAAETGKAGAVEGAITNSLRKGGGAGEVAAGATRGTNSLSTAKKDDYRARESSPNADGLLRFFSVSDLWAARLMPPREKRPALQAAARTAQIKVEDARMRQEGSRAAEGGSSNSSSTELLSPPFKISAHGKPAGDSLHLCAETPEERSSGGNKETKQENTWARNAETETAADLEERSVKSTERDSRRGTVDSPERQRAMRKGNPGDLWPEATDGWSSLVPQGTSEQILREIYCDLPVLSETQFDEDPGELVNVSRDEMCGLSEVHCKELLRWWDQ